MYPYEETMLENQQGRFDEHRDFFKQYGFVLGGGWKKDHGYFDRKLQDAPHYLFLRIPVFVEEGEMGENGATIRLGTPFLLGHLIESELDQDENVGILTASFNQFQEPTEQDAALDQEEIDRGWKIVRELEENYRQHFIQSP